MDQRRFDRMMAAMGSSAGRRRAIAGLLAGTTALLAPRTPTAAKKRKKKCKKKTCQGCPERLCCSCKPTPASAPDRCYLIVGDVAPSACDAICGGSDLVFTAQIPLPGRANICVPGFVCSVETCPVKL